MGFRLGNGYIGSDSVKTSSANQEIIPTPPAQLGWTTKYNLYKMSFMNNQSCTVKINNGDPIYLEAGMGFESNQVDSPIWSFVIITNNVQFYWIGAY